jgi:protein-S-isoprenylcysteine O-methyltransferase Ste14
VTIAVPLAILLLGDGPSLVWWRSVLGGALVCAGVAMWAWTVRLFARIGRGTLAPWDPTSHLVVEGPYRHVRNPMITAVLFVLLGEALLFGSLAILWFALGFFVVNWAWFVLVEEPGLERRFGDEYRAYAAAVPRWLPRP